MGQKITSIRPSAVVCSPADSHAPASNTDAVVAYTAVPDAGHVIAGIAWSYKGGTPAGTLVIADGASTVFSIDITSAGAGFIPCDPFKKGTVNSDMTVTLGAGGSGVTGKLSIIGHWVE